MLKKLLKSNTKTLVILYLLIDTLCVGAGMGVPFFPILFGFPLGWFLAQRISASTSQPHLVNLKILKSALLAASFTFILMVIIWGRAALMLFNQASDFQNFGHPFILYEPKASFIGWLILMIFISPFLQLLTTISAAFVTLTKIRQR